MAGFAELEEDAAPFVPEHIWGYSDGDWPGWPAQEMLVWMPSPVQQAFGTQDRSVVSGPCLVLKARRETAIVAALHAQGYRCKRDNTLVRLASGY